MNSYLISINCVLAPWLVLKNPTIRLYDGTNYLTARQSGVLIFQGYPIVTLPITAASATSDLTNWMTANNYTLNTIGNDGVTYTVVTSDVLLTMITNCLSQFSY
jgi:hypothetical protein